MSDLISRQAAIEELHKQCVKRRMDGEGELFDEFDIEDVLWKLPSAEPEERTAKVEHVDLNNTQHWVFKCLECGQYFHKTSWGRPMNYCPYCGCRLEWK